METLLEEVPRTVNGVDVQKLEATKEAIENNPDLASFTFYAVNEWVDGARNRSMIDRIDAGPEVMTRGMPFMMESDQPEVLMGEGGAPNAITYLLHALASSLSVAIIYSAAERGVEVDKLTISVEGDVDVNGFFGLSQEVRPGMQDIRVSIELRSNAPRSEVEDLVKHAQRVSPLVDTLRNRVPLEISLK